MSFKSDNYAAARSARKAAEAAKRAEAKQYRAIKKHFRRVEESIKAKTTARIDSSIKLEKDARHVAITVGKSRPSDETGRVARGRIARRSFRTGEGPTYQRLGSDSEAQRTPAHLHHATGGHWSFVRSPQRRP